MISSKYDGELIVYSCFIIFQVDYRYNIRDKTNKPSRVKIKNSCLNGIDNSVKKQAKE